MEMEVEKPQSYFLLAVLIGTLVLSFFIFKPFTYALVLAAVFSVVFQPFYRKIVSLTRGRRGPAAFITILIVIVFIFIPLLFLGIQIFREAQQLYFFLADSSSKNAVLNIFYQLVDDLKRYFPVMQELTINIDQYFKQGLSWLIQHLGTVFSSFARILGSSFIFFIALYYLLKDGAKLKKLVAVLSPLSNADNETIAKKLLVAINSVITGSLLVAIVQGMLTMIGFAIFGIPNAVLWGSVAAVAALIPGVGTALVLVPAILFLFFQGQTLYGVGLVIWGMVAVGLIDNFLGPKLVGRGGQLHPLVVLLSVFGGLVFFGPIGLILGPLTVTLLFALLDIYFSFGTSKK